MVTAMIGMPVIKTNDPLLGENTHRDAFLSVDLDITRVIFKCKDKSCKHVWAREYHKCHTARGKYELHRIENGKVYRYNWASDNKCPECGSVEVSTNEVVAVLTEHVCGAKCMSAKGHICECSCNGENHGINRVIK